MVTAKKNGVVFSGALGVDVQSKREATHRALTTSHSLLTYLRIEQEEYFNVFFCAFVGLVGFSENIFLSRSFIWMFFGISCGQHFGLSFSLQDFGLHR